MKKNFFASLMTFGAASLLFQLPAQATNYVLKASDGGGNNSSFTNPFVGTPGNWALTIGGTAVGAPTAGNNYAVTGGLDLRTPLDATNYTFAGDSLTITSGRFILQGSGTARTITVNDVGGSGGLILNGGQVLATATTTLAGNITLANGTTSLLNGQSTAELTVSSNISGSGTLRFTSGAKTTLSGSNSYTGGTIVDGGKIYVSGATATLGASTASLTVNSGTLSLSTTADTTVGSLSGTVAAALINGGDGTHTFTVNQTTSGTYAGQIKGGSSSFILGSLSNSTLTLTGSSGYTGSTTINAGTLLVGNGTTGSLAGTNGTTVNAGTLGGSLASGINLNGTVTIGNSSGSADAILSAGTNGTTGRMASGGNLTLNSDAQFVFDLVTTSGSVASDLFVVNSGTGITTINAGAVFALNATGNNSGLTVGQTFTAIDGGAFNGTSGVFSNLADGATISSNGASFVASYSGGDLIFTVSVVPEPSAWALLVVGLGSSMIFRRRPRQQMN